MRGGSGCRVVLSERSSQGQKITAEAPRTERKAKDLTQRAQRETGEHRDRERILRPAWDKGAGFRMTMLVASSEDVIISPRFRELGVARP